MPTPPLRKRFQIHLSTAIVMMFVAGGLMWANVSPNCEHVAFLFYDVRYSISDYRGWFDKVYGWPIRIDDFIRFRWWPLGLDINIGIVVDLTFALAILFAVYFLCEYLRRRAAQKSP